MSLPISNVVRVSVLSGLKGLSDVNTSMLGLITDEIPINSTSFGVYRAYKDALSVAADFGTNTDTARLAEKVFSQSPNILTGNGSLLIVPRDQSAAATNATMLVEGFVDFSGFTATDYNINTGADILIGELDLTDISTIETSLNSTAMGTAELAFTVSGEVTSARVTLKSTGTAGVADTFTIGTATTGTDIAALLGLKDTATGAEAGVETIKDCIVRTASSVPYFGLIYNVKVTNTELPEVASIVQSLNVIQFVGSNVEGDISGIYDTLVLSGYNHTRCLYYSNSINESVDFAAGYASAGLSVNFAAGNTAATMNLKEIVGVAADPVFSTTAGQSRFDLCKKHGVDCYADYKVPGVASFKENDYFDEVYIRLALKLKLEVAGFNYLKQTNTKIPQTEDGMDGLKAAYRRVVNQFVNNGSFAPGTWTGSTTFGNPEDHRRNIEEFGYWLYSLPVNQQQTTDREARIAPVVQIACKSAGAFHSSDVIVLVER